MSNPIRISALDNLASPSPLDVLLVTDVSENKSKKLELRNIGSGFQLRDLADVDANALVNGASLTWNSVSGKFEASANTVGVVSLNGETGVVTFTLSDLANDVGYLVATDNIATATALQTARNINTVAFDGTTDIVVEPFVELDAVTNADLPLTFVDDAVAGHKRLNMGTALKFNPGTSTLTSPTFAGNLTGDVTGNVTGNVTGSADTLTTARNIQLTGDVTGTVSFDGSSDVTLTATVQDDSHNHIVDNIDGLQSTLDVKADLVAGVVPTSQLPALAVTEFLGTVGSEAAMTTLVGQPGDWCLRSDVSVAFVLTDADYTTASNWVSITGVGSAVTTVNGQVGNVTLGNTDVGAPSNAQFSELDANTDDLIALSGIAENVSNLGTFTGTTIADNTNIKAALQALETEVETKADSSDNDAVIAEIDANVDDLTTAVGIAEQDTNLGTFTGTTIADGQTVKVALQSLETAVETKADNTTINTKVDEIDANADDLITLSGVPEQSTTLGTFSGSTIADGETVKGALQDLETEVELKADTTTVTEIDGNVDDLITLSGVAENASDLGTFGGVTIPDGADIKTALAQLESAVENRTQLSTTSEIDANVDDLVTLSGVAENGTDLGLFSGSTIADNTTIRNALQQLETELETKADAAGNSTIINEIDANVDDLITLSGVAENNTNLGTFTGVTISDSQSVKGALQQLETALENTTVVDEIDANVDDLTTAVGIGENVTNLGVFSGSIISDTTTVKSALQELETEVELKAETTTVTEIDANVDDLTAAVGIAEQATDLGTFTGSTIADGETVKGALQDLETEVELKAYTTTVDEIDQNVDDLVTLTGVSENATDLGTFTGTTIADGQTVKVALQSLETAVEDSTVIDEIDANVDDLTTAVGIAEQATDLGTFTGTTIADGQTVKVALQSLETAVELKADTTTVTEIDGNVDDLTTAVGIAEQATDLGTFTGGIITDNTTVVTALQELETAIEANTDADTVDGLHASQFLRSDQDTTLNATTLTINPSSSQSRVIFDSSGVGTRFYVGQNSGFFSIQSYTTSTNTLLSMNSSGVATFSGNVNLDAGLDVTGDITVTGTVDGRDVATDGTTLDTLNTTTVPEIDANVDDLTTAVGIAEQDTHLGTFTGSTIADNQTVKVALQSLETAVEGNDTELTELTLNQDDLVTLTGVAENATHLGTFNGSIISDDITVKAAIQEVEDHFATKADLVNGVVPNSQIPSLAITEYLGQAANATALVALTGEQGDWAIRTDTGSTWVITVNDGSTLSDWVELATPADAVSSVNGYTGTVVLANTDVGAPSDAQFAELDANADDLITLTGVSEQATDLGTFTGTTIADGQTIKVALQSLETAVELKADTTTITEIDANVDDLTTAVGIAEQDTHLGTFTGSTINDNQTVKVALQSLETAVEANDTELAELTLNQDDLVTLSGVAENSTDLGTFTGTTINDNQTIKVALQSLETAVELKADTTTVTEIDTNVDDLTTAVGIAEQATDLGTFTGTTIADGQTVKVALQSLETAVELKADTTTVTEIDGNVDDLITLSGVAENSTNLGTFTGETLSDNITVKAALQEVETALEGHLPVLVEVHNDTLGTLSKGDVVYISGTHTSGKPTIALADANGAGTNPAIGLVHEDITSGGEGYVIISGVLSNIDTSSYSAGDAVYLSETTGTLTTTRPSASTTQVQKIGLVTRVHATSGSILLIGAGRSNDVPNEITTLTGVSLDAIHLGTFTGTTIADDQNIKQALQALETEVETKTDASANDAIITEIDANVDDLTTAVGIAEQATHLGTFTGSTIADNQTVKVALQSLETAVETKADNTTINNKVDEIDANVDDLTTAVGIAEQATNLGTFTGSTIADNQTVKVALQSLETAVELKSNTTTVTEIDGNVDDLVTLTGVSENTTTLGTFTGTSINDNETIKGALQDLEDAVELRATTASLATVATTGSFADLVDEPTNVSHFTNDSGYISDITAESVGDLSDVILGGVTLATGQVLRYNGAEFVNVALGYSDLSGTPTTVSTFTNDANYITSAGAPVQSVNTQTGSVVLDADDIDDTSTTHKFATAAQLGLADTSVQPSDNVSVLTNDAGYLVSTDNIATATTLQTARTINTVSFNGSADIVVEPYVERDDSTNAERVLTFVDSSTAGHQRLNMDSALTFNPSTNTLTAANVAGNLTGDVTGNASTATTLQTARSITLTGDVTGTVSFDGSGDVSITTAVTDDSHNHVIGDIDNLQDTLNDKADLDGNGKVLASQIPSIAITEYLGSAANATALVALTGQLGDWAIRTDTGSTWVITANDGSTITDWTELSTPADAVTSVNTQTGAVVLDADDIDDTATTHKFATAAQLSLADSALQSGDNISELTNNAGYLTSVAINDVTDVTITSATTGDLLRYNGSAWVNTTLVAGDIPSLDASKIGTGTFDNARIAESNVTQHQGALSITENQISDLQSYITDVTGDDLDDLANVDTTGKSTGDIIRWNGTNWVPQGLGVSVGDAPPSTPVEGDMWWDSGNGNLYIYYNDGDTNQWADATGAGISYGGPETPVDVTSGVPATNSSTGVAGEMRADGSHLYVCTATNTWKRIGWDTW